MRTDYFAGRIMIFASALFLAFLSVTGFFFLFGAAGQMSIWLAPLFAAGFILCIGIFLLGALTAGFVAFVEDRILAGV